MTNIVIQVLCMIVWTIIFVMNIVYYHKHSIECKQLYTGYILMYVMLMFQMSVILAKYIEAYYIPTI